MTIVSPSAIGVNLKSGKRERKFEGRLYSWANPSPSGKYVELFPDQRFHLENGETVPTDPSTLVRPTTTPGVGPKDIGADGRLLVDEPPTDTTYFADLESGRILAPLPKVRGTWLAFYASDEKWIATVAPLKKGDSSRSPGKVVALEIPSLKLLREFEGGYVEGIDGNDRLKISGREGTFLWRLDGRAPDET